MISNKQHQHQQKLQKSETETNRSKGHYQRRRRRRRSRRQRLLLLLQQQCRSLPLFVSLSFTTILLLLLVLWTRGILPSPSYVLDTTTLRGGELGRMVDALARTIHFRCTMYKRKQHLRRLGIYNLPPQHDAINKRGIPNLPQAAVVELLIQDAMRNRQLQNAERSAQHYLQHSSSSSHSCNHGDGNNKTSTTMSTIRNIPKLIWQFNHGHWFRPPPLPLPPIMFDNDTGTSRIIHLDLSEMHRLVRTYCPTVVSKFESNMDDTTRRRGWIWTLCALYTFGGYVIGPNYSNYHRQHRRQREVSTTTTTTTTAAEMLVNNMKDLDDVIAHFHYSKDTDVHLGCNNNNNKNNFDPIIVAMFNTKRRRTDADDGDVVEMTLLASTPKHPRIGRILEMIASSDDDHAAQQVLDGTSLLQYFTNNGTAAAEALHQNGGSWNAYTCSACRKQTMYNDTDCCATLHRFDHVSLMNKDKDKYQLPLASKSLPQIFVNIRNLSVDNGSNNNKTRHDNISSINNNNKKQRQQQLSARAAIEVSISEEAVSATSFDNEHPTPVVKVPKRTIRDRLLDERCNAGWICNRCLKNAWFGTHDACRLFCPWCYRQVMCRQEDDLLLSSVHDPPRTHVDITVSVQATRPLVPGERRIPKIIHQTWFDEPTVDRYPQLARLQNSWRMNPGWEYRFYTDSDIREYVSRNYPPRFLEAFDSVIPGAFKADLFRYLVLLKDGGVYADADILLDINLDSFVTPSMSFFAPRDIVGDYAGENFCIWNGLMGAVPGHTFMVNAVEALVNNIANRVDYHDMEQDLCQTLGTAGEVWKIRALTILSLSGPCLLGNAVNKALGRRNYLSKYDPGWLIRESVSSRTETDTDTDSDDDDDVGDALLLIASRADMGALRFSDVYRNMMVASTGMTDLSKDPILTVEEANQIGREEEEVSRIHYSKFEHVNDVFGAEGIYVDDLVTNEVIRLRVSRK